MDSTVVGIFSFRNEVKMHAVPYEMSDEEVEVFTAKFQEVCSVIDDIPAHLVMPLLLRVAVGTHLDLKGFQNSDSSIKLAQSLVTELTNILVNRTNQHITESN